jgi:hypothetical protein
MLRVVLTFVVVASLVSPAFAQAKSGDRGDFSFGYSTLTDVGNGSSVTFPLGWVAAFSSNVNPRTALVGEVGGNYKSIDVVPGTSVSMNVHTFQGGIRMRGDGAKATPFGQVLAGLGRIGAGVSGVGSGGANGFSIQPGGGVDVKVNDKIAVRGEVDYRFLRNSGVNLNEIRFSFGLVFGIR